MSKGDEKEAQVILSSISQVEKDEFREAFKLFDKDGDGQITVNEIYQVLKDLGFKKYSKKDVKKMVKSIDMDDNGTIDLDEFIVLLRKKRTGKYKKQTFNEELKQAFNVFDVNGDGSISPEELSSIMKSLGESLTKEDIEFMIKCIDVNSDGEIDFKEFTQMMKIMPIPPNEKN